MLPVCPGGFSETNYIDHTTERQEELIEGPPVGQGVCAQLQTGGKPKTEDTWPQALDRQGCCVQAQAEVHTGHLVNLHTIP